MTLLARGSLTDADTFAPSRSRISGSRVSITIARSGRDFPKSSSAFTWVKTSSTGLALLSRPGFVNDTDGG